DVSDEKPKIERRAEVRIFCKKTSITPVSETDQTESTVDGATGAAYADEASCVTSLGYTRSRVVDGVQYYHDPSATGEKANEEWYYDVATQQLALVEYKDVLDRTNYGKFRANKGEESEGGNGVTAGEGEAVLNRLRFDQEYHFFKLLEQSNPIVFDKLKEKLRVFDPAFHSQTPESFNSRLTFLAQCLRQGPTVGASDTNATSANNLAFGRPPVCVLRLGDFFNCKIIPENLSIAYEPLVWDLNTEGTGVQPMIAKVSLTFSFIGGSDIRGAITRLQNAASFNYYANASLYDNRADRVYRNYSQETNGSIDHDIIADKSTFYDPQMQN
ncbi:MAG: hypothetical protein LUD72_04730, partial [Bacteroidales bacterium]|nr:hypothetical protein [Bacteroidales bacterium]